MRGPLHRLRTSPTVKVAALIFALFTGVMLIADGDELAEFLGATLLALAVAVLLTYSRAFWRALTDPHPTSDDYLLLGIGVSWLAIGLNRAHALAWRWLDRPAWMADHWTLHVFLFLGVLAACLHVIAPNTVDGRVPWRNVWRLALAVLGGVLLVLLFAGGAGR